MIRIRAAIALAAVLSMRSADAAPAFIPNASQSFEGFTAINAPRPDVPVGALWIEGYGPTGPAASPDNLETIRSLNGVTIGKDLQLSLSAGLFSMFGIDPRYRDRFSARFTDLSIVRVKSMDKLAGPPGEARIVEALKAGSVTVTTDREAGLNARTIGWQVREAEGSTTNGQTRTLGIEGRDLVIAIRVATWKAVASEPRTFDIRDPEAGAISMEIDGYKVIVDGLPCLWRQSAPCPKPATAQIGRINSRLDGTATTSTPIANGEVRLDLPVPRSDGAGGLYSRLRLRFVPACNADKAAGCRRYAAAEAMFEGDRLETAKTAAAKGWSSGA